MILPDIEPQSIYLRAGDDRSLVFDITDGSGADANLAGVTFEWRLRDDANDALVAIRTTAGGDISVSGNDVTVTVYPVDTTDLLGEYRYQLRATDATGRSQVVAHGVCEIGRRFVGDTV